MAILMYRKKVYPYYRRLRDALETLDTFGNYQKPVFSLGVSQHMHKITNLWKFELNWSSKLCAFRSKLISRPQIKFVENYFFLENYVTSEGAVSQCFIPSISPHYLLPSKVYAHKYFE